MVKVKICGICREEDVEHVNTYNPDYAGFVFAPSRRMVTAEHARRLCLKLRDGIKKVGVFVDGNPPNIADIVMSCRLDVIQLHGNETQEYIVTVCRLLKRIYTPDNIEIWKAVRVYDASSLEQMQGFTADAFVLDRYLEGKQGGTGLAFDWGLAADAGASARVILAGGLNPQNVGRAVKTVKPYAVDTSSGVESNGVKDGNKIREFIEAARAVN